MTDLSSKSRTIRFALLVTILALLAQGGGLAAQELASTSAVAPAVVDQLIAKAADNTVLTMDLVPESGSDVQLAAMKLDLLDDGSRMVRGLLVMSGEGPAQGSFDFVVDTAKGTYRTIERKELQRPAYETGPGDYKGAVTKIQKPSDSSGIRDKSIEGLCEDNCHGSWTVTVSTLDPVFVKLTETRVTGTWGEFGFLPPCPRWREFGFGNCWAANPSSLGTHWFVNSCSVLGPGTNITNTASYWNYDFGFDNLRTDVFQTANVRWNPGIGVGIGWSHQDFGEGSFLIYGSLSHSGSNNCF